MLLYVWFESIRLLHPYHLLKRFCWLVETLSFCNSAAASLKRDLMTRCSSEPLPRWENASVAPPRSLERAKLSLWSTMRSCLARLVPSSVMGSAELRGQVERIMIHLTSVLLVRCAHVKVWPDCAWPNMRARVRLLNLKALHVWKTLHRLYNMSTCAWQILET